MRYSVLLPTRNGGEFLENCIRSILEQDYGDFELVISDNANMDGTPAVISRFSGDPRVKTLRNETAVSVTENWNNAYRASSGDYILMMGDDDCLLPGYFKKMDLILERHQFPDCVVHNAYSYVAPLAIDGNKVSYFGEQHFRFDESMQQERRLMAGECREIVRDMFRFRVRIPLNMQTTLIARRAAESIRGGVFQPPFPDHYALNSLLLTSDNWVFSPERLLVVGVSPKSFGHYVYSNQQGSGLAYLGMSADFPGRLPGNELMNGMHVWLNMLLDNYPERLPDVAVDRAGYVRRQVYAWYMQKRLGAASTSEVLGRCALLSVSDWLGLLGTMVDGASWARLLRQFSVRGKGSVEAQWHGLKPLANVSDIRGFAAWLKAREAGERVGAS